MAAVAVDGDGDGGGGGDSNNENDKAVKMAETAKTVKDVADDGERMVRERCLAMIELEWKRLLNVSDMRGKLSLWISLFTMTRYKIFILHYEYPMSPFSLHIYKGNERMGI
jgi:hypothetical protein